MRGSRKKGQTGKSPAIIEEARTQTVYNWLQYFSPGSLRKEFEESGFNIEEYYSDVAGTVFSPESVEFAIVAKKS